MSEIAARKLIWKRAYTRALLFHCPATANEVANNAIEIYERRWCASSCSNDTGALADDPRDCPVGPDGLTPSGLTAAEYRDFVCSLAESKRRVAEGNYCR